MIGHWITAAILIACWLWVARAERIL